MNKYLNFTYFILFVALGVSCCGAFFSIIGITSFFSGATISTGMMGLFLELSKLCSVTFLYRYWDKINRLMKVYICVASLILIFITSFGISGFLLSAYQASSIEFKLTKDKVSIIENKKIYFSDMIVSSKIRIKTLNDMRNVQESRLSETLTNSFLTRNPIQLKQIQEQTIDMVKTADIDIKTEQNKIENNSTEIQKINEEIINISSIAANKKDIRTFQFLAEQFGTTMDIIAKWFILVIICVFDPLAITLIIAYNVILHNKNKESLNIINSLSPNIPSISPNIPSISPENNIIAPLPEITPGLDPFYRRMFKL